LFSSSAAPSFSLCGRLQGMVLLFLGMLFMFDSAMLALGDILFLMGLTLTIGKTEHHHQQQQ
jgi:hypothetical protein